jgi:hypothetical protein
VRPTSPKEKTVNRNAAHTKLVREILEELNSGRYLLACWASPNGHAVNWDDKSAKVWHHHLGLPEGTGDIVGIITLAKHLGIWFELEVKTGRGETSEAQVRRASLVRTLGGHSAVVRSVDEAKALVRQWRAESIAAVARLATELTP